MNKFMSQPFLDQPFFHKMGEIKTQEEVAQFITFISCFYLVLYCMKMGLEIPLEMQIKEYRTILISGEMLFLQTLEPNKRDEEKIKDLYSFTELAIKAKEPKKERTFFSSLFSSAKSNFKESCFLCQNALGENLGGNNNEAFLLHKKAIEIFPDNPDPYWGIIAYLHENKKDSEAFEVYQKLMNLDPQSYKKIIDDTVDNSGHRACADFAILAPAVISMLVNLNKFDEARKILSTEIRNLKRRGSNFEKSRFSLMLSIEITRSSDGSCFDLLFLDPAVFENFSEGDLVMYTNEYLSWESEKVKSLIKENKLDEAIKRCEDTIFALPNESIQWLNIKAIILSKKKQYKEAIEIYDKILKNNPQYLDTIINKGITLSELEKYPESIEMFEKVLEINPELIIAIENKADVLFKIEKFQESVSAFDKVLEINASEKENTPKWNTSSEIGKWFNNANNEYRNKILEKKLISLKKIRNNEQIDSSLVNEPDGIYLFFDTETTGLPRNWNAPLNDLSNWPRLVQIAWILCDKDGNYLEERSYTIKPEGFRIPTDASSIHGITTERAEREGVSLQAVLIEFQDFVAQSDFLVAHNISFDEKIVGAEFLRKNMPNSLVFKQRICTKEKSTNFCAIPSPNGFNDYKWPKLGELYYKLFGKRFNETHDALSDIRATAECFWELKRRGIL